MPDIAPLVPSTPGPQPSASGGSLLPAALVATDGSIADFLGQLTAALKSLANGVGPLPTGLGRPQLPALQAAPADSEAPPAAADPAPKLPETDVNALPELLAALGIVALPPMLQPQPSAAVDPVGSRPVEPTPSAAASLLAPSLPVGPHRPTTTAGDTAPAPDAPTTPTPDGVPSPAADLPTLPTVDHLSRATADLRTPAEAKSVLPPGIPEDPSAPTSATTPPQPQPGLPDTTTATLAAPPVAPERVPTPDHAGVPPAIDAASATLIQPQAQQGSASQSGSSGDGHQHRSNRTVSAVDTADSESIAQVGNDQAFNAAMAQASAPAGGPVEATPVQPAEVVSQIVHQAELYRLPGNRGVRIQLHPEDLGGVQVTVRYAAGGGVELHINVEHAATGALVQAGWTELRDALATQGISPDRLVMSVTGPDSANQLDFSSNGGGTYRSDSGLAQFGQGGQSDRQHPDGGDDGRFSRAWSGRLESTSATDDLPRVATSGAASRIDYRA